MFEPAVVAHKASVLTKQKKTNTSIRINMPVSGIVTVPVNLNWFV